MAEDLRDETTEPAGGGPPGPGPSEPTRRALWLWFGVGAVIVVIVGVVAWTLVRSEDTTAAPEQTSGLDADLVETFTLTRGEARCVVDRAEGRLTEERIRALASDPEPDDADQAALDEILTGCSLHPAGSEQAAGPQEGQANTYGDDDTLDALWDQCSEEGTAVCDELFNEAPEGSEYEAFGDTCGGRGDPQVACAPDALAGAGTSDGAGGDAPGTGTGDDSELERLKQDCAAGDVQACLTLEFQAPEGSDYAEFGRTCGGRPDDDRCDKAR